MGGWGRAYPHVHTHGRPNATLQAQPSVTASGDGNVVLAFFVFVGRLRRPSQRAWGWEGGLSPSEY